MWYVESWRLFAAWSRESWIRAPFDCRIPRLDVRTGIEPVRTSPAMLVKAGGAASGQPVSMRPR